MEDIAQNIMVSAIGSKPVQILGVQYWTLRRQSLLIPTRRREDRLKPDS
jgi:hypothetical protein